MTKSGNGSPTPKSPLDSSAPPPLADSPVLIAEPVEESDGGKSKGARLVAAAYSGPLPPPDLFRAYQEILPDAPERILKIWEKEVDHRHAVEDRLSKAEVGNAKRGQWFGFVLGLGAMAFGAYALFLGYSLVGFGAVIAPIAALVGALLFRQASSEPPAGPPAKSDQGADESAQSPTKPD